MRYFKKYLIMMLTLFVRFIPDKAKDRWAAGAATGMGVAGLGAIQLLSLFGITAVAHSSGAAILTGSGGYIAGTYGIGWVVALLTFPLVIVILLIVTFVGLYVLLKTNLTRRP